MSVRRPRTFDARWLRRMGIGLGLASASVAIGGIAVYLASERVFAKRYPIPPATLRAVVDGSPEQVERGRHLATIVSQCQFCHGSDLGGREAADDFWIGRLDSTNLTAGEGGIARRFSTEDWVRAIRFGVRADGRSLLLMPSRHLSRITDADLAALIAYLRQVPPVDRMPRQSRFGPVTRLAIALGGVRDIFSAHDVATAEGRRVALRPAADPAYGAYLVELGNCRICHKADLRGGLHPLALPDEPEPPSLVGAGSLPGWTVTDFAVAMRAGRTPDGRVLDREYMPWPAFAGLSDLEIEALWSFLRAGSEAGATRTDTLAQRAE